MTIIIDVTDQQIAVKGHKVPLAPHSKNFIKLTFLLSSEWKNFKTFAQFRQSNNPPVNVYLDESNSVYVPREIKAGNFTVMLYGAGESIIGTTNCLIFDMVDNCFSADAIETDLTPTLYQQLLNEFKSYLASTKVNSESATASENAAKSYATAADASAQSATTSANNAIAAEKSAKDSATAAAESATASATSAGESEQSKTQAQEYAQNAYNSAVGAESAKDDAEDARDEIRSMRAEAVTLSPGSDATASYSDGLLSLGIPRGDKGEKGNTGNSAGFGTVSATVDDSTGTPSVEVTASGADTAKNFAFAFHNLKGQKGDKGDTGETGATGAKGDKGDIGPQGPQGEKGNKGDKGDKGDTGEVTLAQLGSVLPTDTASGSIASFSDGSDIVPAESVVVSIEPVQDLHGYYHPWPAGGGVNKFNPSDLRKSKAIFGNTQVGQPAALYGSSATNTYVNIAYLTVGTWTISYAMNGTPLSTNLRGGYICDSDGIVLQRGITTWISTATTLQIKVTVAGYLWASFDKNTINLQIESGSSASPYAPYSNICPISGWTRANVYHSGADTSDATTYSITFPSAAGTVYGGTLDVTNGVLTVDRAQIASYAGETLPSTWISDRDVYSAGATPTTGAQVVYELATPITYHLTPQEITTLLGQNNIWADTGDMSVTYRADTKLYIDKKFTELQALILEN